MRDHLAKAAIDVAHLTGNVGSWQGVTVDLGDEPSDMSAQQDVIEARPGALKAAVAIAALEAAGIGAYGASIGVAGLQNPGTVSAPIVQIVIYLLFAAGIAVTGWALWNQRHVARTPFVVIQLFALVVGYTLMQGDGDGIHRLGWLVLGLGVVGIALAMSPLVGKSLQR